jgi:hypothetical protein
MSYTDEEGRPPTAPEANAREGFPHSQTFVYHFGSWNEALRAAGLPTFGANAREDEDGGTA